MELIIELLLLPIRIAWGLLVALLRTVMWISIFGMLLNWIDHDDD